MRLFIAVDVTEDVKKQVSDTMAQLKSIGLDAKFTKPENLHFTMKFLGEVNEDRVNEIQDTIRTAIKDFKPFHISVEGLGYFGNPSYIKTLWIDSASPGREELVKLAKSLNNALNFIRQEDREPKPHITIARVKSARNRDVLLKKIDELKHVKLGEMDVKLVKLKQSVLSKEGPHYTDLKVFKLA